MITLMTGVVMMVVVMVVVMVMVLVMGLRGSVLLRTWGPTCVCVCVPGLVRWERGSGRRVEETQDYQLGTQLLLGGHKWAHNSTQGGTKRQTAVAQVGTQHKWVNKDNT